MMISNFYNISNLDLSSWEKSSICMNFLFFIVFGLNIGQYMMSRIYRKSSVWIKEKRPNFTDEEVKREIEIFNALMADQKRFEFCIKSRTLKDDSGRYVTATVFKTSSYYICSNSINDKNMHLDKFTGAVDFLKKGWVVD